MAALDPKTLINLERAQLLLLDDHPEGSSIIVQIIRGFGVRHFFRCTTVDEAQQVTTSNELHLILINANLKKANAYEYIGWLRQANLQPNSFAPTILITGHTQRSNVERARDCGANIVLAKPVSPMSVLERVIWVAREKRPYVRCATYAGPDRRFRDVGPPDGLPGRRYNDPAADETASESSVSPEGFGASLANKEASR